MGTAVLPTFYEYILKIHPVSLVNSAATVYVYYYKKDKLKV